MLNQVEVRAQKAKVDANQLKETDVLVKEALGISFPAWPLQNTVAVNPFWFMRGTAFDVVTSTIETSIHTSLLLPGKEYRNRFAMGDISKEALSEALDSARLKWPTLPQSVDDLIKLHIDHSVKDRELTYSFAEFRKHKHKWLQIIINDVGKYASAYLDDNQAIAPYPWSDHNFWHAWLEAQGLDRSIELYGIRGYRTFIKPLEQFKSNEAITFMLGEMSITSDLEKSIYMKRLIANVLGWMSQFRYLEWQNDLGHPVHRNSVPTDLLAVRMAYDYALYKATLTSDPDVTVAWRSDLARKARIKHEDAADASFKLRYVYQLAWELSYQKRLATMLKEKKSLSSAQAPKCQMVFCIDVRSEMLRRHIEEKSLGSIQTLGFAGFFGLPFGFNALTEKKTSLRLPVLLKPALTLSDQVDTQDESPKLSSIKAQQVASAALSKSFFRNLRKNNLSSFAYVELFGPLYIEKVARKAWLTALKRMKSDTLPDRFSDDSVSPKLESAVNPDHTPFSLAGQVARAAAVLRHMGLTDDFAPLVIIVGHGSETTNNAFGSSLDCGACGGHAGDINARVLADLLNEQSVRKGLAQEGIQIPESTRFLAAVHETVTDEVYPLDITGLPEHIKSQITESLALVKDASIETRKERNCARSNALDNNAKRRAHNWSEVRPEWGLAGNACFIVAPRERTKGLNLSSRSFLHDYDWQKDATRGYETLELVMTAPMVVTNWINLQYYASSVAPQVYGAGNKVIHNLVNEIGVVEGNGGDLRVGLPLQSVHDGERLVHDPLRLSVFIEAPRDRIETIIEKHQVVRDLVENGWLHLIHIDPTTLKFERRSGTGSYVRL